MLSFEKVEGIIKSPVCSKIEAAREMSSKLRLHVDGTGMQTYLAKINGYENKSQYEAREKHAISNKFLTEELLRPTDNVFNARGGSKNYTFNTGSEDKQNEFVTKLTNVRDHSSLSDYIENVWFQKYVTDPNGLIFMEIESSDDEGGEKIEPCYKSIDSIRAYDQNGIFVDWVIFEPHVSILDNEHPEDKTKETQMFWAVDEVAYYLYQLKDNEVSLVPSSDGFINPITNSFEAVPAVICSNIIDNVTGWKKSPIDSQIGLLDKYLVDNSVLNITQFFHNYPIPWEYVDACPKCNGTTTYGSDDEQCDKCGGTGKRVKKDPTDKIELRIPDGDGQKIDPPAGYITTPIDAMNSQVELIDRLKGIIFYSEWGTHQEKGANETATGRFIDVQPVNNRLDKYSKSAEMIHTALVNFLGKFYFPETFERGFVQYGRRYLLETPDQIWKKYLDAKKEKAPVIALDLLLSQFLESEFRENERMLIFESKKAKLEPFIHWDIKLVQELNVDELDYKKKLYFSDWVQSKQFNEIIDGDMIELNKDLSNFVADKTITNINLNNITI